MNIDWMCLLRAIGTYGLTLLCVIIATTIMYWICWAIFHGAAWVLNRFVSSATSEAIGVAIVILLAVSLLVVFPIYVEYQKTCP